MSLTNYYFISRKKYSFNLYCSLISRFTQLHVCINETHAGRILHSLSCFSRLTHMFTGCFCHQIPDSNEWISNRPLQSRAWSYGAEKHVKHAGQTATHADITETVQRWKLHSISACLLSTASLLQLVLYKNVTDVEGNVEVINNGVIQTCMM